MPEVSPYRVKAYNTAHASENKIHDDVVAQRMGFTGALVPGVEVYAYMMHLAVQRWGRAFLEHGAAECRFSEPVYDGEIAEISGREDSGRMSIEVNSGGRRCATGSASLPAAIAAPPVLDSLPSTLPPELSDRPPANAATLPIGGSTCTRPLEVTAEVAASYLRDVRETDPLYSSENLVHPGIVLRMCNQALLQNVKLGPWIHVGSKVQNFSAAQVGDTLTARGRVSGNYERKGHLFVDMDILVLSNATRPVARVQHTAIYQPRQMAQGGLPERGGRLRENPES